MPALINCTQTPENKPDEVHKVFYIFFSHYNKSKQNKYLSLTHVLLTMDEKPYINIKNELKKCPTGINGLDEITFGGLPHGRPTLVCGNAGCGKTLLSMEFIVRGAEEFNEPGVFMSFEEKEEDLIKNFNSLGFNIPELSRSKKISLDYVHVEKSEIEETGEYDLDGLFIRLENAIDSISAKRVVLDTLEALFSGFQNEAILRAELRRLFRWLKDKEVTAIITGESAENKITKFGLEEYVADCVIYLDHRIREQISTRRLKIIKYRGSKHGLNEYPFLISEKGISLLPITSLNLNYEVSSEGVSTGIKSLDEMFGKKGYYRGSAVLISGTSGSGKTSFACQFLNSACSKSLKCLYFVFEESQSQILRDMKSIGIDLQQWVDKGLLLFSANRPIHFGLEMHLLTIHKAISDFNPDVIIIDSITNLIASGPLFDVKAMLTRLLDFMKMKGITAILTDLTLNSLSNDTEIGVSSLTDTWLRLSNIEKNNTLKRTVTIVKARGMKHSDQVREFIITDAGIEIISPIETTIH